MEARSFPGGGFGESIFTLPSDFGRRCSACGRRVVLYYGLFGHWEYGGNVFCNIGCLDCYREDESLSSERNEIGEEDGPPHDSEREFVYG